MNGIKSNDPPKYSKLSAKTQISKYKYNQQNNNSLFAQNKLRIQSSSNNSVKSINSINPVHSINNMPKTKANKSTPTKAWVTFSDTTTSTPQTNTSSNTETIPSGSLIDAADNVCFTETLNKIFSKNLLAILTGRDAILKKVRDCIIRDDPNRLREKSTQCDLSVKHGCVCLDDRIAIPKAIKDAVLEDIHTTHPGSFALLSLAENIWWPYIHRDILAKTNECKACTEIDEDKIPGRPYLTEEQWSDKALCSDTEVEKVICNKDARAKKEQEKMKDGEPRAANVQRTCRERSIQVKLARKIHENQRQKKNLDG